MTITLTCIQLSRRRCTGLLLQPSASLDSADCSTESNSGLHLVLYRISPSCAETKRRLTPGMLGAPTVSLCPRTVGCKYPAHYAKRDGNPPRTVGCNIALGSQTHRTHRLPITRATFGRLLHWQFVMRQSCAAPISAFADTGQPVSVGRRLGTVCEPDSRHCQTRTWPITPFWPITRQST